MARQDLSNFIIRLFDVQEILFSEIISNVSSFYSLNKAKAGASQEQIKKSWGGGVLCRFMEPVANNVRRKRHHERAFGFVIAIFEIYLVKMYQIFDGIRGLSDGFLLLLVLFLLGRVFQRLCRK